jgi:hypothetical protein
MPSPEALTTYFIGCNKIWPDIAHFEARLANLRAFSCLEKAHEGPMETPDEDLTMFMSSPCFYLPIPCHLRPKLLRF